MNVNARARPHWMARSIGSAAVTPVLLVSSVAATLWLLRQPASSADARPLMLLLATLGLVALGCAALALVRPQRAGLSPPHVMLSLGFGGMLFGLLYDIHQVGPQRLADLCSQSASLSFADSLQLHIEFLPGMHAGMLMGGLLAIPSLRMLRADCGRYLCSLFAQNMMCSTWMIVGMTAGALWMSRWQWSAGSGTLAGMLGGMFVGMTWGMVISVALYRGVFAWRRRVASTV